jgi:hypothetical protein
MIECTSCGLSVPFDPLRKIRSSPMTRYSTLWPPASHRQLENLSVVNEKLMCPDRDVNVIFGNGLMVLNAAPERKVAQDSTLRDFRQAGESGPRS